MKLRLAGPCIGLFLSIFLLPVGAALAAQPGGPGHSGHYHKRVCGSPAHGAARCHAQIETDASGTPLAGSGPGGGYVASELRSAYNLAAASTGSGAGRTIAIVDAYDAPTAFADLNTYRSQTGLPPISANCSVQTSTTPCFQQVNQSGQASPRPAANSGWAQEISLDVQMASAICERCNILLVEAKSNYMTDLGAAVDTAASFGPAAISNSYGGGEFSGETSYDHFYTHPGATITVSSGDSGTGAEYPATSPGVMAVGGTQLVSSTSSRGWSETVWSGAGSGCSAVELRPSWQPLVDPNCGRRAEADVSAVADPNTGVSVYDSYGSTNGTNWYVFGGTSVAAPIVASVSALAGHGAGPGVPYAHASSLYDVTSGRNGRCKRDPKICNAGSGWDGPTGLGTPNGLGAF
jgi:subtilase family serine protease